MYTNVMPVLNLSYLYSILLSHKYIALFKYLLFLAGCRLGQSTVQFTDQESAQEIVI